MNKGESPENKFQRPHQRPQLEMYVPTHMTQQLVIDRIQPMLKELELAKKLTANQKVQEIIEDFLNEINQAAKGQYLNRNFFNYERGEMFNQLFEVYNSKSVIEDTQKTTILSRGLYKILQDPEWANRSEYIVSLEENRQFYNEFTYWLRTGEHLNQTIKK